MYSIRRIDYKSSDTEQIRDYFNKALSAGRFALFPRKKPITQEEIDSRWGDRDDRESLVAVDRKVVAAATLRYKDGTARLNITKDPDYDIKGVGTDLTKEAIRLALDKGYEVIVQTSVHNKAMIRIMEKLGYRYKRLIRDFEDYRYRIDAPDYDIYEWRIREFY